MNTRDKQKELEKRDIESFEHNLKIHYDAMQNELNTIIRNTIPSQLNIIKTIMWINVIFLGVSLNLKNINITFYILLILILATLFISFYIMIIGRAILYGNSQRIALMKDIKDNKWTKTNGIYWMMYNTQRAIRYNAKIIIVRSKFIKYALILTCASLLSIGVLFIQTNKDSKCQQLSQTQQFHQQAVVEEKEDFNQKNKVD